jgi:CubicO group peptidase (beta-lactamase class C family)
MTAVSKPDFTPVRLRIQEAMAKAAVPSVAVAVARHGEIVWEDAFGWANRERRIPATPHTMYSLASTSKPFTTTGIMKLVEQGKLDLDNPLNQYLSPDSPVKVWIGDPKEVTVRRLANHTAGLPRHEHFFGAADRHLKPPMEETIRRYGNVVTLPGERYRYSNIGFGILDHLIERHSGMSFGDFMLQEFFLPLGMTRASVDIGPGLEDYAAERYEENGRPIPFYDVDHRGASSVYCSAHDLARFGMFHMKQRLPGTKAPLSDATLDAMQVPTADRNNLPPSAARNPPASGYGVGWVVDDTPFGPLISHAGGMGGTVAQLVLLPREGIAIAAMANCFCGLVHGIDQYVLPVLAPDRVQEVAALATNAPPAGVPAAKGVIPELLGDWEGLVHTYEKDLPFRLSFKPDGDIHAQIGEQLPTLVHEVTFGNGWLGGRMAGRTETFDACRRAYHPYHHLHLDLKVRGDTITGAVIQIALCALSHWATLKRRRG